MRKTTTKTNSTQTTGNRKKEVDAMKPNSKDRQLLVDMYSSFVRRKATEEELILCVAQMYDRLHYTGMLMHHHNLLGFSTMRDELLQFLKPKYITDRRLYDDTGYYMSTVLVYGEGDLIMDGPYEDDLAFGLEFIETPSKTNNCFVNLPLEIYQSTYECFCLGRKREDWSRFVFLAPWQLAEFKDVSLDDINMELSQGHYKSVSLDGKTVFPASEAAPGLYL